MIADWQVRKRINNSLEEVEAVRSKVEQALRKLCSMHDSAERQLEALKAKYNDMIVNA